MSRIRLLVLPAFVLILAACFEHAPDPVELEADARAVEAAPAPAPAWRAIECRVLCGSVELDSPARCRGSDSFGDCWRECYELVPAGNYCPLTAERE